MDESREIPEPQKLDTSVPIPASVALMPEEYEAPEALPYDISFAKYNKSECQMDTMEGRCAKSTLTILRDVGVFYTAKDAYLMQEPKNVEIIHISRANEYEKLYRGLDEDTEVKEIKHRDKKDGVDLRVFYYTIDDKRIFYLVATRFSHYDTTKGSKQVQPQKAKHKGRPNRHYRNRTPKRTWK